MIPSLASAEEPMLFSARAKPGQIRVDGDLGEWRGVHAQRVGSAADGSVEARLAYDDKGLYIGARVQDDKLVRTANPSPREDALVLSLALPDAVRLHANEVWLYAGEIGRTRAVVNVAEAGAAQRALAGGAQIVEGPLAGGYVIEAYLPWAALPGGAGYRFARAALRLHDVDRAGQPAHEVSSSNAKSAERWPWLALDGGVAATVAGFLQAKELASAPAKLDWVGDVAGDGELERVLVIGTFAAIIGSDARVSFQDLPATSAADVRKASLEDLDADDKPELLVTLRQKNELGVRELWQAFDLKAGSPRALFAVETRKETSAGFASSTVSLKRDPRTHEQEIHVELAESRGLSPDNFEEARETNAEAMLLPWGPVAERVYAWDGTRFAVVRERKNPHALATAAAKPAASAVVTRSTATDTVVHQEPPGSDALIAAYKAARGIAANATPRFEQHANLAEDKRIESLLVFGAELVVVGKGFRGGTGFFYFGLPVQEPSDVLRVFTGDVTGDGRREVFARVRQRIGDVQREILLGYTFMGEAIAPILQVEVRRARGADSVGNVVSLVREGTCFALRIEPGFAHGWSETNYPFTSDSSDGIGLLLLPWKDAPARYRWDGKLLAPR